jgi:glyoxylase-like metal-dependent hydrolase (beta-lactamase superfamily II)
MELKQGIHRFEGIPGVNCYWATSDEGVVLIDTGNPKTEKKILSQLEMAGKSPGDVKFIIITHADIDHAGSAAALKRLTGAKLAIHEADAGKVKGEEPFKEARGILGVLFKIMMRFVRFHRVEPDMLLKDGDEIAGFSVIHTPGHTEGSIMLYRPGQVLITGDTLLCNRKGQPRGPIKAFTLDMHQAWKSLGRLSDLSFEMMLPGHGKPMVENASKRVRDLIENHPELQAD